MDGLITILSYVAFMALITAFGCKYGVKKSISDIPASTSLFGKVLYLLTVLVIISGLTYVSWGHRLMTAALVMWGIALLLNGFKHVEVLYEEMAVGSFIFAALSIWIEYSLKGIGFWMVASGAGTYYILDKNKLWWVEVIAFTAVCSVLILGL